LHLKNQSTTIPSEFFKFFPPPNKAAMQVQGGRAWVILHHHLSLCWLCEGLQKSKSCFGCCEAAFNFFWAKIFILMTKKPLWPLQRLFRGKLAPSCHIMRKKIWNRQI
jgi:hypothetical protein